MQRWLLAIGVLLSAAFASAHAEYYRITYLLGASRRPGAQFAGLGGPGVPGGPGAPGDGGGFKPGTPGLGPAGPGGPGGIAPPRQVAAESDRAARDLEGGDLAAVAVALAQARGRVHPQAVSLALFPCPMISSIPRHCGRTSLSK